MPSKDKLCYFYITFIGNSLENMIICYDIMFLTWWYIGQLQNISRVSCQKGPIAMRKHGGYGPFFRIPSIYALLCAGKYRIIRFKYPCVLYRIMAVNTEMIRVITVLLWASYQIRKIAGCACAGNAGNVFPATAGKRSRHALRHVRTHVPWCMLGSPTSGFLWSRWRGEPFPAFPAHAQHVIFRIWQEANVEDMDLFIPHGQYHGYSWPGNTGSLVICSQAIDLHLRSNLNTWILMRLISDAFAIS